MILVSSCLAGHEVRYNGTHCLSEKIGALLRDGRAAAVCPELMGGFSTPREPAEIQGGSGEDVLDGAARVVDRAGLDVTALYLAGAYKTLEQARAVGADTVILKENSPSCGSSAIYDGHFNGMKIPGSGVTGALLRRHGIRVLSEEEMQEWDGASCAQG